jgi:hypothetical protein
MGQEASVINDEVQFRLPSLRLSVLLIDVQIYIKVDSRPINKIFRTFFSPIELTGNLKNRKTHQFPSHSAHTSKEPAPSPEDLKLRTTVHLEKIANFVIELAQARSYISET